MEPLESAGSYHPYNPYNQYNPYMHGHPQRGWPYYSSPMVPDYMDYYPPAYPTADDMFYPNYPPLFDQSYAGYQQEGPREFGEMFGSDDALLDTLITDYLLSTLSQPTTQQKPKQIPPVIPKPLRGSFAGSKGNRVPKPVSFDQTDKDVQPATSVNTLDGSEASAAVSADLVAPRQSLVASTTVHP